MPLVSQDGEHLGSRWRGIWGLSAQGCSMRDLATGQQAVPLAEKWKYSQCQNCHCYCFRVGNEKWGALGVFPGGPVVETLGSQCRGCRFDPWPRHWDSTCCTAHPKKKKNGGALVFSHHSVWKSYGLFGKEACLHFKILQCLSRVWTPCLVHSSLSVPSRHWVPASRPHASRKGPFKLPCRRSPCRPGSECPDSHPAMSSRWCRPGGVKAGAGSSWGLPPPLSKQVSVGSQSASATSPSAETPPSK